MGTKNDQQFKSRLGAIGENLVANKLMELGYDAINANDAIKNCKKYDLVIVNPDTQKTTLVQVKTHEGKTFPLGFTIEQIFNKNFIENLVGPWVFVYVYKDNDERKYEYYIVSKSQLIDLAIKGQEWYFSWDRKGKKQPSEKSLAGIEISWLRGEKNIKGSKIFPNKPIFENPLKKSAKDNWEIITDKLQ